MFDWYVALAGPSQERIAEEALKSNIDDQQFLWFIQGEAKPQNKTFNNNDRVGNFRRNLVKTQRKA